MKRWLTLFFIAAAGLAAMFLADGYYRAQIRQENINALENATAAIENRLAQTIQLRLAAVEDLKAFLLATPSLPDSQTFDRFAAGLLTNYPTIRAVQYVDPDRFIRYIYPLAGNEPALGLDLRSRPAAPFVEKAIRERRTVVQHPTVTVQDSLSIVARAPLYRDDAFLGLAQGVFDITAILNDVEDGLQPPFKAQLLDATGKQFWGVEAIAGETRTVDIPVGDNTWTLALGWDAPPHQPASFILLLIWGGGALLLLSTLFIVDQSWRRTTWLTAAVTEKTAALEERNSQLLAEVRERQQAEEELRVANRALKMLSEANQALIRATSEPELLAGTCRIIVAEGGYRLAWIGLAEKDEAKSVRPVAQAGFEEGYLDTLELTWADDASSGRSPIGAAIRTGKASLIRNFSTDPASAPWREEATRRGYSSCIALPLIDGAQILGALNIYAAEPDAFTPAEVRLLTELADDLTYGLIALRTRTAQEQAEKALEESQARLQLAVRAANLGLWDWNLHTNTVYFSPEWKSQIGYADHEISNDFSELQSRVHPDDLDQASARVQAYLENPGGNFEDEFRFQHKDGSYRWILVRASLLLDDDGQPYRMLGAHIDITGRKQTEEALRLSEARYADLYENAPDMYLSVEAATLRIIRCNQTTTRMTGFSKEEILGRPVPEMYHPDSMPAVQKAIRSFRTTGQVRDVEMRLRCKDGSWLDISLNSSAVYDETGQIIYSRSIWRDITERKEAEHALRESEERFRTAFEYSASGMCLTGLDGKLLRVNQTMCKMFGYAKEELQGMHFNDITHPEDLEIGKEVVRRMFGGEVPGVSFEKRYLRKGDEAFWAHITSALLKDASGQPRYFITQIEDITKRRHAEEELRLSEELFSNAFHVGPASLTITRIADGKIIDANETFCSLFEFDREEVVGHTSTELNMLTPEERRRLIEKQLEAGGLSNFEMEARSKSGKLISLLFSSKEIELRGELCHVTTLIDITQRKQAEEALRESEFRYRQLLEVSPVGVAVHSDGRLVFVNPAGASLLGAASPDELIGTAISSIIHPDGLQVAADRIQRMLGGEEGLYPTEDRYVRLDGSIVPVEVMAVPLTYEGKPAVQVMVTDITERKQAEQELEFRSFLLNAVGEATIATTLAGEIIFWNSAAEQMYGWQKSEVIGRNILEITPSEEMVDAAAEIMQQLSQGNSWQGEFWVQRKDGEKFPAMVTNTPLYDVAGDLRGVVGVSRDITERKQAEDALRRYADRLQSLHQIDQAILAAKSPQVIAQTAIDYLSMLIPCEQASVKLYENEYAIILAVYSPGKTKMSQGKRARIHVDRPILDQLRRGEIVKFADLSAVEEPSPGVQGLQAEGWRTYLTAPLLTQNELIGTLSLGSTRANAFKSDDEEIVVEVAQQLAIAIWQTRLHEQTRRHAEELEQRVAERTAELKETYRQQAAQEERQRLARDLHDAVSQVLFSAMLLAEALPRLWQRYPDQARQSLVDLQRLTRGALAEMRNLLLELRPVALAESDLVDLIRYLSDALAGRTSLDVILQIEGQPALPPEPKIALYRIGQEALNNVVKHAQASQVSIDLRGRPDYVSLTIRDDGQGFDPEHTPAGRLGLNIMAERAAAAGAGLHIDSHPGQGTEIAVLWPAGELPTGSVSITMATD